MSKSPLAQTSIRRRLLVFLVGALLLMGLVAGGVTYWVALRSANDAYDRSLLDPALDIADYIRIDASGAHLDLPQKALEVLVYDHADTVIFQVRSDAGVIISGDADLPSAPEMALGEHRFFEDRKSVV